MEHNEVFSWLSEQGWKVQRVFHPADDISFVVTAESTFRLYRPRDGSLVFLTNYHLSPRQLLRLVQLTWQEYLDLIWELRSTLFSDGFYFHLRPSGCELRFVEIGLQLWEPALTKNTVLQSCLRVSDIPALLHSLLEKHLSAVETWKPESEQALVKPPGDKPIVHLG